LDTIFTFSPGTLAQPLLIAVAVAAVILVGRAALAPYLARIGLRNAPRRLVRTALIVLGLMLATTFVASSLAIDDTITLAVKTVAVFNLGRIDEDITGGQGTLNTYPENYGDRVQHALGDNTMVAGIAPALVAPDTLVADTTARQVRGGVAAIGLATDSGGPLSAFHSVANSAAAPPQALGNGEAYLNSNLASLMNAHVGDAVTLYSIHWLGQRFTFHVRAIVTGGLLGDAPQIVLPLSALQTMTQQPASINHIYIANAGNGLTGVGYSDAVADTARAVLPDGVSVAQVKRDGVNFSIRAQDIFGRILTLYTLFAFAIGLLLIFLIFTLLAAERRAELGMARAVGMRRGQVVWTLLFEGAAYDLTAAIGGVISGLIVGAVIVGIVSPTLKQLGFPLTLQLNPASMVVAFALGLLFTLLTIALAAWTVSHMTIAAALRDLPEPRAPDPTLATLARNTLFSNRPDGRMPPSQLGGAWLALLWGLTTRGLVPLALGAWLLDVGAARLDALIFSVGLSFAATGVALLVRWLALVSLAASLRLRRAEPQAALVALTRATRLGDRLSALVIGGILALYWSLPFDALASLGLPRFSGAGIQIFFIAGVMMVAGCVLALAPNLDLLLAPLKWLAGRLRGLRHVARIALVYPSQQRFRTGIGLALFSLVVFTMVVMDVIAASTTGAYDNLPAQAANYDIAGQPLFSSVGGVSQASAAIQRNAPAAASAIAATGEARPLPLGVIQPGQASASWRFYPASEVSGSLLQGVGLPLAARASGFGSDAAVWHALQTTPGDVVVDASALSLADAAALGVTPGVAPTGNQFLGPPIAAGLPGTSSLESLAAQQAAQNLTQNGGPTASGSQGAEALGVLGLLLQFSGALHDYTLSLHNIALRPGVIAPTTLWVADLRGGAATKLTVVGIVDNSHSQAYGILGSQATFAPTEQGLAPFGAEYYYFKLKPGANVHTTSLAIGSALNQNGFETTVIQDVLLNVNGPKVYITRVLVGLVGLTLLVGMAALAVTGSRAVVERRQQIGMLRALGFHRSHVQLIFLIESLLVGAAGVALGVTLGLILCRNIFAVDFFAQFQSGLTLIVPWRDVAGICGAALAASLVAALLPAIQAGLVAPADALRYE